MVARRAIQAALAALITVLALSACGSSEASKPTSSGSEPGNLITAAELKKFPERTVQQDFLNFWSDLQFRAWPDAAAYFDPRFRRFVGTASVIGAKRLNATSYPLLKPTIVRIHTANGETTVYYTLRLSNGTKELDSITWHKVGGNWQIVYDSRLDGELEQLVEQRVEIEKKGSLPRNPNQAPSPAAARAGNEASQVQARFSQQRLKNEG